jgi:hypothetical protein
MRPFRRPVVLGTELVSFSALLTCQHAGIRPAAMIEPGERTTARWPAPLLPRLLGVPLLLRTEVVAIEGREWVEAVVVRSAEGERRLDADGVIITGLFRPEAALLRASHIRVDSRTGGPEVDEFGRCSDPCYFAAGNLLRTVETAGWCWAEGRAVARAMLRARSHRLPEGPGQPVELAGEALAWVMPQRLAGGGADRALPALQLRARYAAQGRIAVTTPGQEIFSRAVRLLPERRLLAPVPGDASGLRVSFVETPD